jgi:hypothetical protein
VHRIAARMDGEFELVAGALSSDPARAKASAAELGLDPERSYGSFAEMAKAEARRPDGIEAVAIVTPNHMHYPAAKAFLDAGIHVICDKPLTATLADARKLCALVEKSGRLFVLTHNYTGYPMIRQAREMVEQGVLGEIRVVQAEYPQDWLTTDIESSGQKQAACATTPSSRARSDRTATSARMPTTSPASSRSSSWTLSRPISTPSCRAAAWTTTPTCCCASRARKARASPAARRKA